MAEFEPGHLDADRADEVGTPLLLRPIMWMLGGSDTASERHQQQEEGQDTHAEESARSTGSPSPRISEIDDNNDENMNTKGNASPPRFVADDDKHPSPPPGVVRASDGDFCDDLSSSEEDESSPTLDSGGVPSTVAQMAELALSESSSCADNNKAAAAGRSLKRSNRFQHPRDRLGKSCRTMSWSDERGNDLATYHYAGRQPSNPDLSAKPIKSAMKSKASGGPTFFRPGSAAATAPAPSSDTGFGGKMSASNSAPSKRPNPSKFLPSGIVGGKGGGVIMPSGGGIGMPSYYPSNSSTTTTASRESSTSSANGAGATGPASGNFSPQWGWYISTTPPTPEKYCAAPPNKKNGKKTDRPLGHVPETKPVFHRSNPSPVFKKGGVPSATMGWPSVPL